MDIIYHLNPQISGEILKKDMLVTLPFREGEPISSYLEKNKKNRRVKSKNKNSVSFRNTFSLKISRVLAPKIAQKR